MFEQLSSLAHALERMVTLYARVLELLDSEKNSLAKMNFESLFAELREKDEVLAILRRLDKERLRIQDHFAMLNGLNTSEVTLKLIADSLVAEGASSTPLGHRLLGLRTKIQIIVGRIKDRVLINEKFIEKSVANIRSLAEIYSETLVRTTPLKSHHATYTGKRVVQKAPQATGGLLEKRL